jgi:hypothetical protein
MFEYDIIEAENFEFNHYLHHFDDYDDEHPHFNEELGCIEMLAECIEEIEWR